MNKIILGFQNTVDFELAWAPHVLEALISAYGIRACEICGDIKIRSQRDMLLVLLHCMREGVGVERTVCSSEVTRSFASRFPYQVTLGGTAVRAAIAMSQIGYPSTIHACSMNHYFRDLIPSGISWMASVPDEGEQFHPHVIIQYPQDAHICAGNIDITTRRANRVIFSHDPPSIALHINPAFQSQVREAQVFLAASYNVMQDAALLQDRLKTTIQIMDSLPPHCITVMEDGCFESAANRRIVTDILCPHLQIFSMNEDEMQDRIGHPLHILNPSEVAAALQQIYRQLNVPILICHTAHWAAAYGRNPGWVRPALEGGIAMAATRFRRGDSFSLRDYQESLALPAQAAGEAFARQLTGLLGEQQLLCLPSKELSQVAHPTTIGLGDAFIGGLLPNLLPESQC